MYQLVEKAMRSNLKRNPQKEERRKLAMRNQNMDSVQVEFQIMGLNSRRQKGRG